MLSFIHSLHMATLTQYMDDSFNSPLGKPLFHYITGREPIYETSSVT
ncbi:hypothetical protein J43TS9_59990 [Paenibacillus cineris]|nr:hypothetical protein J43TS9_59990 [Paenibacillus cineris]